MPKSALYKSVERQWPTTGTIRRRRVQMQPIFGDGYVQTDSETDGRCCPRRTLEDNAGGNTQSKVGKISRERDVVLTLLICQICWKYRQRSTRSNGQYVQKDKD